MAKFSLKILDKSGIILYEDSAETMANLVVNREYEPGDSIIVETSEQNIHVWLQVDDAHLSLPSLSWKYMEPL